MKDLSQVYLSRLTVPDVEDALAALAARAPRQAQMARAALLAALKDAERRGQRFDKDLLTIKKNNYQGREAVFLDWEEILELQSWLPEFIQRIVPVAALTGMRQGELFDLKESDLVLDEGYLRVRSGKTASARRVVRLSREAVKLLREQLLARPTINAKEARHGQDGASASDLRSADDALRGRGTTQDVRGASGRQRGCDAGGSRAHGDRGRSGEGHSPSLTYVFPTITGGRWSKHNFGHTLFRPARKKAGLEHATFHSLRHSYVSLCARAGMRQEVIEKNAGWSPGAAQAMFNRYRGVYADEQDIGLDKLDALVRGNEREREEEAR